MRETSLLVQVGDVWIDPLRVDGLEWHGAIAAVEVDPLQSLKFGSLSAWCPGREAQEAFVEITMRDEGGKSVNCYDAHGVTLEDAARIINRAREAHMGKR